MPQVHKGLFLVRLELKRWMLTLFVLFPYSYVVLNTSHLQNMRNTNDPVLVQNV